MCSSIRRQELFLHHSETISKLAMLKRYKEDFVVVGREDLADGFFLLRLRHPGILPEVEAGQFVEVRVPGAEGVMLRRPISIHDVDQSSNELHLLVHKAGEGTRALGRLAAGASLDVVFPLGKGFDISPAGLSPLLVGGGVGVAPLLLLGRRLKAAGAVPTFLFGARSAVGLLRMEEFRSVGSVFVTTEDGSEGVRGFVTDHPAMSHDGLRSFSSIMQCGPTPMMKAVAKRATESGVLCYASLENTMACGIGVCLCCVTDTNEGNKRVCADGPVFNVKDLKW